MEFWNAMRNTLTRRPKSPTELIQKFLHASKTSRVQLEVIRNDEILLQIDSLRSVSTWLKIFEIDRSKYQNGFVIFFILDRAGIENHERYIKYKKSDLKLSELDEMYGETLIRTFAKFIAETDDPVFLGKEMKIIIDGIFNTNESDPQAMFSIRYINEEKMA